MKVGDLVRTKRGLVDIDPNESLQYIRNRMLYHAELGIILKVYHTTWYSEAFVYFPTMRSKQWQDVRELINVE